ncbi:MAG: retroviral-like aspartic protease family protein [Magnetococcales bacterium]|nr:retroviral-like aspartic protease family protein [Magnetococcales bacterium]
MGITATPKQFGTPSTSVPASAGSDSPISSQVSTRFLPLSCLVVFLAIFMTLPVLHAETLRHCKDASGRIVLRNFPCDRSEKLVDSVQYPTARTRDKSVPLLPNRKRGQYWINTVLNGTLQAPFLIDTGANVVLLPMEMYAILRKQGAMTDKDIIGTGISTIADGSKMRQRMVLIRSVKIGEMTVRNIRAVVGGSGVPPLLGTTVLEKLGAWRIDHRNGKLVIE